MSNDNAGGAVENPYEGLSQEELVERLKKSEAKIVDLKKSSKDKADDNDANEDKSWNNTEKDDTSLDEKIAAWIEKALEAMNKQKEDAQFEQNQNKTNGASIDWDAKVDTWFKKLKASEFDKMSAEKKTKYMEASMEANNWDVVFE